MTDIAETIARVKQLDAKATPGPWVGEPDGGPHRGRVEERSARGIETVAYTYCGAYDGHGARNAELVAHYRTAAPLLATALEAAMAENERLGAELEMIRDAAADAIRDNEHVEDIATTLREEANMLADEVERLRERVARLEEALRHIAIQDDEESQSLDDCDAHALADALRHCGKAARAALEGKP